MNLEVTILFRPVGPKELPLIAASNYREFPPRLPEQPIFYPVLNEEYARQIAISDFVSEHRPLATRDRVNNLVTPREDVYQLQNSEVASRLGVDRFEG